MADHADEILEDETEEGFPPPERRVFTQPYDLSVKTILEQWDDGTLVLPEIQREYVWDNARASRLIESLLLNIPIPVVYFAETDDAKWEIIDGHQRVRSVVRYVNNEFALSSLIVLADLKRMRFNQLPDREQRFLKSRTMRAVVISAESHPSMKFEIFERLNTGAIVLTAQELRNSIYRGSFNRLLHELAREPRFRTAVGTRAPRARMVDEELILRFLALRADLVSYRPPLKTFLNSYMRSVKDADEDLLEDLTSIVSHALDQLTAVFPGRAFRVADATGDPTENAVNRAIFDAQLLAFSWITDSPKTVHAKRATILRRLSRLYRDEAFMDATSLATGDRSRTLYRVNALVALLKKAGLKLNNPRLPAK